MSTIVVAIGGNSLIRGEGGDSIAQQRKNLDSTCEGIVGVLKSGYHVVITHGNGPQVGAALVRSEIVGKGVPSNPLDVCVAETQGSIGYLLQQRLQSKLGRCGMGRPVATILTQVLVSRRDPAFRHPKKPIGPFYSREEAEQRRSERGWVMIEDASRGYRRVVASPAPRAIIEILAIQKVVETGAVVICCGGGGIPVMLKDVSLLGLEAVVDKDRASGLLASQLGAEILLISTPVDRVSLHYGTPSEEPIESMTARQAKILLDEGQFPPGSMGPKIEAAIDFLERGGKSVIITSPDHIQGALEGQAGTVIHP
jgi:carbamate kinase